MCTLQYVYVIIKTEQQAFSLIPEVRKEIKTEVWKESKVEKEWERNKDNNDRVGYKWMSNLKFFAHFMNCKY